LKIESFETYDPKKWDNRMPKLTFDLDVLRSYVAGIDLGTFARAADRLGRSNSAISAQLKKLEEQVGTPLLQKSGRNLVPTDTGEILLTYAKRLLELNDEAASAVRDPGLEGQMRIGLQQDFGEGLLTKILGDFSRAHPRIHVEAQLTSNAELIDLVRRGRVDLAVAWKSGDETPYNELLAEPELCWIGAAAHPEISFSKDRPLPLVVAEQTCLMRTAGVAALDQAGIPWRIAFTSASLSGIWSAVAAGLGLTVRTRLGLPDSLQICDGLPRLPTIGLVLHQAEPVQTEAIRRLSAIIREELLTFLSAGVTPDKGAAATLISPAASRRRA
jgi:DNA-binding transcriptional LysR family regulator